MEKEMAFQIKELMSIMKKRKWIIIAITLVSTIVMTAIGLNKLKNNFSTMTSLIAVKAPSVNNDGAGKDEALADENLMQTYSSIAKSYNVIEKASDKLNRTMSPDDIEKSFTVSVADKTPILTITVKGNNQSQVLKEISAISNSFIEEAQGLYPSMNIKTLNKPRQLQTGGILSVIRSAGLGFFGGLVVALFIITLMDYLDTTIRKEEDIEKYFDAAVLGNIPKGAKK